jgi:hypothetical protein
MCDEERRARLAVRRAPGIETLAPCARCARFGPWRLLARHWARPMAWRRRRPRDQARAGVSAGGLLERGGGMANGRARGGRLALGRRWAGRAPEGLGGSFGGSSWGHTHPPRSAFAAPRRARRTVRPHGGSPSRLRGLYREVCSPLWMKPICSRRAACRGSALSLRCPASAAIRIVTQQPGSTTCYFCSPRSVASNGHGPPLRRTTKRSNNWSYSGRVTSTLNGATP